MVLRLGQPSGTTAAGNRQTNVPPPAQQSSSSFSTYHDRPLRQHALQRVNLCLGMAVESDRSQSLRSAS